MSNDQTPTRRYRLLRILEYVGDAEFIHEAIERRHIKDRYFVGSNYVSEALLGQTAELLHDAGKPTAESADIAAHIAGDEIESATRRLQDT